MARYFLDLIEGDDTTEDDSGAEFAGPQMATLEAVRILADLVRDLKGVSPNPMSLVVRIRGPDGFERRVGMEIWER
jgi:hypothetical protein